MASTTVSVEGDLTYRDALAMLARNKGLTVARMVRAALDAAYGDELGDYDHFIHMKRGTRKSRAKRVSQKGQIDHVK